MIATTTTSLVNFGTQSIESLNEKTGAVTRRKMNKQEFKKANPGLKGNALTNAFNAFIRDDKADTGDMVKAMAEGKIIPYSVTAFKNSLVARFYYAEKLVDKAISGTVASVQAGLDAMTPAERDALIAKYI